MTQSLALKRILESRGHQVVAGFIGENPSRPIPDFFRNRFDAPLHTYLSPVFAVDRRKKGVRPWATFFQSLPRIPRFWAQAATLGDKILPLRPDLLVNFFDILGGVYAFLHRPPFPVVAVAHQFLFLHPDLPVPQRKRAEVGLARMFTRATGGGASLRLALSFRALPDLPEFRVRVVPPLLRQAVLDAEPTEGTHILAYVLNPGYGEELDRWQAAHPQVDLHCFWDRTDTPPAYSPRSGLTYHRLDDRTFLELLVSCRGFTSTARFESVCEEAYLGKPVMVVPTANHLEQMTNALDAQLAGIAEWRTDFDLTEFEARLFGHTSKSHENFRNWVNSGPDTFVRLLEGLVRGEDPMRIRLRDRLAPGWSPR